MRTKAQNHPVSGSLREIIIDASKHELNASTEMAITARRVVLVLISKSNFIASGRSIE